MPPSVPPSGSSVSDPHTRPPPSRWSEHVLGRRGPQRLRASQSLLAALCYLGLGAIGFAGVPLGILSLDHALWLLATTLLAGFGFFAIVRSGLNLRFGGDPSLTMPQMTLGVVVAVLCYAIAGPLRGMVHAMLLLVLAFGMFILSPRQIVRLALLAFALLAVTMVIKASTDPAGYPPLVEAVHLACAAVQLVGAVTLTARMTQLRERMKRQKTELAAALRRNHELATRDELTGLANRRYLADLLQRASDRQRCRGGALSVVLIDIDHFKHFNERHGHAAGDAVLRRFAQVLLATLRPDDAVGRWGGEEFLLVLPDADPAQAVQCLERLRRQLAGTAFGSIDKDLRLTFSAGVSACALDEPPQRALERADAAMVRAKVDGRDRTVTAALPDAHEAGSTLPNEACALT